MLDIKTVKLKTEAEIIASWKDKEKIVVSVVCATFNHELYIEDAITGFLMQETDFAFEVIIHDDASTDKTADIVREYQSKYPKIIKPIYQSENQYSKGNFRPSPYAASFGKGEYVAMCEGDDYWVDKYKLTKQYRFLKYNLDFDLVITDYNILTQDNYNITVDLMKKNQVRYLSNLSIRFFLVNAGYMAPPSWFMRKKQALNQSEYNVDGSFAWFLDILNSGNVYILWESTVVYRVLKESASHSELLKNNIDREKGLFQTRVQYLEKFKLEIELFDNVKLKHSQKMLRILFLREFDLKAITYVFKIMKSVGLIKYNSLHWLRFISLFIPLPNFLKKHIRNYLKSRKWISQLFVFK